MIAPLVIPMMKLNASFLSLFLNKKSILKMKKTTLMLLLGLLFNMTFAQKKLPKDTHKTNTYPLLHQLCKELRLLDRKSVV